jgi:hypothetical protein
MCTRCGRISETRTRLHRESSRREFLLPLATHVSLVSALDSGGALPVPLQTQVRANRVLPAYTRARARAHTHAQGTRGGTTTQPFARMPCGGRNVPALVLPHALTRNLLRRKAREAWGILRSCTCSCDMPEERRVHMLHIEDSRPRVHCGLVLHRISNQSLCLSCSRNIRWCDSITLCTHHIQRAKIS